MYDMNERVLFPDPTDDKITPLHLFKRIQILPSYSEWWYLVC